MAAELSQKVTHSATIPWADIQALAAANAPEFLQNRPALSASPQVAGLTPGLIAIQFSWVVSPQRVDQLLRANGVDNLPTLGGYNISILSGDPLNALVVTWEE